MDLSKLHGLTTETLMAMKKEIDVVLASRLDTEICHGRRASFKDNSGNTRIILIKRISAKSISGSETSDSLAPGMSWRVPKGAIQVEPVILNVSPTPVAPKAPLHRPVSADASW